jgi:ankyrin repeat protein
MQLLPVAMGDYSLQPLCLAAQRKHLEMMKLLLNHGAPIYLVFGADALLHYAWAVAHLDIIMLLLDQGVNMLRSS